MDGERPRINASDDEDEKQARIPGRDGAAIRRVVFGRDRIRIEDVVALARNEARAEIDPDPTYRARLEAGEELLRKLLAVGKTPVYGVQRA